MNLWELSALALPLITILLVQTVIMAAFAYYVTFRIMGKDYDAAVIATGQCGFGMGATPNAMANMETFTGANGQSPKAFFVVPLVVLCSSTSPTQLFSHSSSHSYQAASNQDCTPGVPCDTPANKGAARLLCCLCLHKKSAQPHHNHSKKHLQRLTRITTLLKTQA